MNNIQYIDIDELKSSNISSSNSYLDEDVDYIKHLIECCYRKVFQSEDMSGNYTLAINNVKKCKDKLREAGFAFLDLNLDDGRKSCQILPFYIVTPSKYCVNPPKGLFLKNY